MQLIRTTVGYGHSPTAARKVEAGPSAGRTVASSHQACPASRGGSPMRGAAPKSCQRRRRRGHPGKTNLLVEPGCSPYAENERLTKELAVAASWDVGESACRRGTSVRFRPLADTRRVCFARVKEALNRLTSGAVVRVVGGYHPVADVPR